MFPAHKADVDCIPVDAMRDVLAILQEEANYPLLIHCNKGKVRSLLPLCPAVFGVLTDLQHRTGCAIACHRLLNGYTVAAALDEYRRYAGSKARVLDELYIRAIDIEAIRPVKLTKPPKAVLAPEAVYPTPPSSDRSVNLNLADI